MKKALSLILAFVLCLSLCACGKHTQKSDLEEAVVGKWTGTYIYLGATSHYNGAVLNAGDKVEFSLLVFKGGAVEIIHQNTQNLYRLTSTGTWEITDGTFVITCDTSNGDVVISWEINSDATPKTMSKNGSNSAFPQTITKED